MKSMSRFMLMVALLVAAAPLAGCGRQTITNPEAGVAEATPEALRAIETSRGGDEEAERAFLFGLGLTRVQFVHASPDAPGVDIRLGWRNVAKDLNFPNNTRCTLALSGERRVQVNVAGTSTTVIDATVPFESGTNYSVFAVNEVASLEPLVLTDDLSAPEEGFAHVRFIHLSPDAPAVDVALQGGAVVFGDYAFKEYTAFTPLPAGTHDLEVRLAGTSTVVLPLPGVTVEDGKIYTVFAKGFVGGAGAQALGAQIIVNRDASKWRRPGRGGLARTVNP